MNLFLFIVIVVRGSTALPGTISSPYQTTQLNLHSSEQRTDAPVPPMWNQECLHRNLSLCETVVCICCQSEEERCSFTHSVGAILGTVAFVLSLLTLILNAVFIRLYLRGPASSLNPKTGVTDKKKVHFHGDEVYENISRHTVCGQAYADLNPATKLEHNYMTLAPMSAS